jgi:uncharacterized repeat protein (TIGR04138 family)
LPARLIECASMPPSGKMALERVLDRAVEDLGVYPLEAYHFVQQGLAYTIHRIYGSIKRPDSTRHVTGQQLCHGLRELACKKWGFLAQAVLQKWNITETIDFGRIVFSLARHNVMATTQEDSIEDFRNVYQFSKAFEDSYRIPSRC